MKKDAVILSGLCALLIIVLYLVATGVIHPIYADEKNPRVEISEDDLYELSHVIAGEANDSSKIMKQYVGSVVLNRVSDDRFPNTIYKVVHQQGQYSCTWDGNFSKEPNEETLEVAKDLLENGSIIDASVVWQAEFQQGSGVYDILTCPVMGTQMYFCY